MDLDRAVVLEKYGVELIGASIEAINRGENRESFKRIVEELGGEVARSVICHSLDECFAGYRNHHNLFLGTLIQNGADAGKAIAEYARNWGVDEKAARQAAMTELDRAGTTIDGSVPVRPDLLAARIAGRAPGHTPPSAHTGEPVRDALIDYLQVRKIPRNTRMYDRLSMAYGLELRLPFLDHRLVEFSFRIPQQLKIKEGIPKYILKKAAEGIIPNEIIYRKKQGFAAPIQEWLRTGKLGAYARERIFESEIMKLDIFNKSYIEYMFAQHSAHKVNFSGQIWTVLVAAMWYDRFIAHKGSSQ